MASLLAGMRGGAARMAARFRTASTSASTRADSLDIDKFDKEEPAPTPTVDEAEVVAHVWQCLERSKASRTALEGEWVEALAFCESNQWVEWDHRTRRLTSLYSLDEKYRFFSSDVLRELLTKVVARATMNQPDASPTAESEAQIDQMAASEARAVLSYLDDALDSQGQTRQMVAWCLKTTTAFLRQYWDHEKEALVPRFGLDGQIEGVDSARVGDVCEEVVPGLEVFLDPSARSWDGVRWLIHVKRVPPSYVAQRYGLHLEPDNEDPLGYLDTLHESRLSEGTISSGPSRRPPMVTLLCMEERPSPKFPQGRYVVVAGKKLATYQERGLYEPYEQFSFIPLGYEEAAFSPYDKGIVDRSVLDLQSAYNRLLVRLLERIEKERIFVFESTSADISPSAYDNETSRVLRRIPIMPGSDVPHFVDMAPPGQHWMLLIDHFLSRLQDKFGVHDISQGKVPSGVTAGNAIELLQQSDTTQMSSFTQRIERFCVKRAEGRLRLYSLFAREPRMVGLDDSGDPGQASMRVSAFEALSAGGRVRVSVTPGSALPKSPAAKNEQILQMYQMGLFGPPGGAAPDASAAAIRLMEFSRSDEVLEHLDTMQAQAQQMAMAQSPNPAMEQAQVAAKSQMDEAARGAQEADRAQAALEMQQARDQGASELEAQRHEQKLQQMMLQAALSPPAPPPQNRR